MFTHLAGADQGDSSHFCVPLDEITTAKFTYYAAKLLELLNRYPIRP